MAVYAFDGTWNFRDLKDAILTVQPSKYGADASYRRDTIETNVHRFKEFVGAGHCEYLQGVGTRFSLLGRLIGGAFGAGAKWRIRKMYRRLCRRYHEGDTNIDIIGFSRGAAISIHFANVIAERGIPRPDGPKHLAWHYDTLLGWSWRMPKTSPPSQGEAPRIRFLGLFDTVASIGLPIGLLRNRPTRRWRVTTIPENVLHSFHAMALDEVRATFALIRPTRVDRDPDRHYELWFRGVHSNIGGGYADRGLSDIALGWMMEMYLWTLDQESEEVEISHAFLDGLAGLWPKAPTPVPPKAAQPPAQAAAPAGTLPRAAPANAPNAAAIDRGNLETLEPNPDGELGRPSDIRRQAWRAMPPGALIHHSVYRRSKNLLLDHHRANRRLLRPIPGDARPVYDPPYFNHPTPRDEAEAVALEAFYRLPVRAAEWLLVRGQHVVRSDDWLGPGTRRRDVTGALTRKLFVDTCTEWLLNGFSSVSELQLPAKVQDYDGKEVDAQVAAEWLIDVLTALAPFVPSLREYRERTARARTATRAPQHPQVG
jgi:hypothetical protein